MMAKEEETSKQVATPRQREVQAWRNGIVRDEYYTSAYEVFGSEEDEYVYEVNKWCRIKGFQTKIARSELD